MHLSSYLLAGRYSRNFRLSYNGLIERGPDLSRESGTNKERETGTNDRLLRDLVFNGGPEKTPVDSHGPDTSNDQGAQTLAAQENSGNYRCFGDMGGVGFEPTKA